MANNPNNIGGSAYSDDGGIKRRIARSQNEEITNSHALNRRASDLEGLISMQADIELSQHNQRDDPNLQRAEEAAISERPDEAEEASTPPGTIGDRDIMSEHIPINKLLKYKKGT